MNMHMEFSYTSPRAYLAEAKRDLIDLMAEDLRMRRDICSLKIRISDYEGYAEDALGKDMESLAREIATKIASLDSSLAAQVRANLTFHSQLTHLKDSVYSMEHRLHHSGDRLQYMLDYLDAAAELDDDGYGELERKMAAAGIGKHANAGQKVLERIRRTSSPGSSH